MPDFAGGHEFNPINPTRPRLKKTRKNMTMANFV